MSVTMTSMRLEKALPVEEILEIINSSRYIYKLLIDLAESMRQRPTATTDKDIDSKDKDINSKDDGQDDNNNS
jgi:hypothetical protein